MKQVCFWPSPFVLTVVMALVATIVRRLTLVAILVRFQTKWAATPPSHIKPITFGNELWTYDMTNCPAQRCLGIRAPLNFVSSLLWLCSALPFPNRSLNAQITSLRNFVLLWTAVGLKKKRPFSNGKTYTSWLLLQASWLLSLLGARLPFCFSRSSPCRADTCFFVSPCSLCHSFNPCRWPAASLCRWPSVQTSFIVTSQKPCERSGSWAQKKRQGPFLAWAGC